MSTCKKIRWSSLFVGVGIAMLLAAEPAQAQTVPAYNPRYATALPLFMDTRASITSLPGSGWYTIANIQNTSASVANVRITAKPKQGLTGSSVVTFTVAPRSSKVVRPDNPNPVPANTVLLPLAPVGSFGGSVLIESDQPLVVLGELSNIQMGALGVAGGTARGFYNGILVNESTGPLAFPMMKGGFNGKSTVVYVKNTSSIAATGADSVKFTLKTNDGMTYDAWVTSEGNLNPGESRAIRGVDFMSGSESWTKTCTGGANVGAPGAACFGAAQLTSTNANLTFAAVAVQRAVAETNPSPSVHVASFQRTTATESVSCSTFRNAYQTTARSGINIMNAGTSSVDITLTLLDASVQAPYTKTFPGVPAGSSVAATGYALNIGGFPDGAIGTATITSTLVGGSNPHYNAIIATVSESGVGTTESSYQCTSTSSSGSYPIFAPLVKFNYSDANHPIAATSDVRIHNTAIMPANLAVTYTCGTNRLTTYTVQKNVAAGSSVEINSASFITAALPQGIPTGNICYAVVTSSVPIVGTVTERSFGLSADDATYEFQRLQPDVDFKADGSVVYTNPCPVSPLGLCSSGVCCSGP